ncbi:hypothetical protein HMPREF9370_1029 [Neisseria wadsworthii 9715]|uniref:Uncharacterized protein n=1 Tax=Neisseria wadsworthii 9715 TaxID=1030841 RepID=G4CPL9_9NEIS|nr:hypothetical protein HMPREF9370_1029 [Neisseria wadsworthii 9715]
MKNECCVDFIQIEEGKRLLAFFVFDWAGMICLSENMDMNNHVI